MSTLLLLGAELGLILVLFFLALLVYFIRRRRSDKRYVADFISEQREQRLKRREAVKKSMQAESLLPDEELDVFLDEISLSEKKLYKKILNMYLGFDRKCLAEIRNELSVMNDRWIDTMHKSTQHAAEAHSNAAGQISSQKEKELNDKIDSLTEANNKIADELTEAMETMGDIVKEYSLMYAGKENETMDRLSADYDKIKAKSDSHTKEND